MSSSSICDYHLGYFPRKEQSIFTRGRVGFDISVRREFGELLNADFWRIVVNVLYCKFSDFE
jgi:hypothetical protein